MAQVKTVSATYGRKHNLGDYNSAHIEVTIWMDLEEGDLEGDVIEEAKGLARNHVMTELSRLVPQLKPKVGELYLGKKVVEDYGDPSNEDHPF